MIATATPPCTPSRHHGYAPCMPHTHSYRATRGGGEKRGVHVERHTCCSCVCIDDERGVEGGRLCLKRAAGAFYNLMLHLWGLVLLVTNAKSSWRQSFLKFARSFTTDPIRSKWFTKSQRFGVVLMLRIHQVNGQKSAPKTLRKITLLQKFVTTPSVSIRNCFKVTEEKSQV